MKTRQSKQSDAHQLTPETADARQPHALRRGSGAQQASSETAFPPGSAALVATQEGQSRQPLPTEKHRAGSRYRASRRNPVRPPTQVCLLTKTTLGSNQGSPITFSATRSRVAAQQCIPAGVRARPSCPGAASQDAPGTSGRLGCARETFRGS